jgi:hypothetical protein
MGFLGKGWWYKLWRRLIDWKLKVLVPFLRVKRDQRATIPLP